VKIQASSRYSERELPENSERPTYYAYGGTLQTVDWSRSQQLFPSNSTAIFP